MRWPAALLLVSCAAPVRGPTPRVLQVERGQLLCVALDGSSCVAGSSNDRLRRWTLPDGEPGAEARAHRRGITCVALSARGEVVTGGPDRRVRVWDAELAPRRELTGWARPLSAVGFTSDGGVVGASMAGELLRFDAAGERRLERDGPALRGVMAVALSADGERMAWAADGGSLRVWDTATGAKLAGLRADGLGFVAAVALSGGGLLATGSRDVARVAVWDPARQVLAAECRGVAGEPRALAFAPDGVRLAVASRGGALQVFDARSGLELARWSVGEAAARRVTFDPAGERLAAAGPGPAVTWFDVGGLAAPSGAAPGPGLEDPVLRAEELGEQVGAPADGRFSLSRLVFPGYDPPELRPPGGPVGAGEFPPRVRALAGRRVTTVGYPLAAEAAGDSVRLLLSRFPPGCCSGSLPVPDEWIEVTAPRGAPLDPLREVEVTGVLEVGEVLDELGFVQSLYRLRAERVGVPR